MKIQFKRETINNPLSRRLITVLEISYIDNKGKVKYTWAWIWLMEAINTLVQKIEFRRVWEDYLYTIYSFTDVSLSLIECE